MVCIPSHCETVLIPAIFWGDLPLPPEFRILPSKTSKTHTHNYKMYQITSSQICGSQNTESRIDTAREIISGMKSRIHHT